MNNNGKTMTDFLLPGDEITFTERLKVTTKRLEPLTIPRGTQGVIVNGHNLEDQALHYLVRCFPATGWPEWRPLVLISADQLPAVKTSTLTTHIEPEVPDLVYDDHMPGFFREDGAYLIFERGSKAARLLYRGEWTVTVVSNGKDGIDLSDVNAVIRPGKGFALLPTGLDKALLQLNFHSASRVTTWTIVPCEVEIDTRKKKATITLLFSQLEWNEKGKLIGTVSAFG